MSVNPDISLALLVVIISIAVVAIAILAEYEGLEKGRKEGWHKGWIDRGEYEAERKRDISNVEV